MRKSLLSVLIATTVLAGAAAPSLVYAQATAPNAATQAQPRQERHRPLPSERIDARLAYLKTALKITPQQEPQWNALAEVLRQQARARDADVQQMRARRDTAAQNPQQQPSAIDRLEQRQQRLAKASAQLDDVVKAARPLYAAFSPDQKRVADDLLDRGGHGHRFHHGR